jgi:uncharacterized protein (TIGR03067 family)
MDHCLANTGFRLIQELEISKPANADPRGGRDALQGTWKSVALGPLHTEVTFSGNEFRLLRLPKGNPPVTGANIEFGGKLQIDTSVTPSRIAVSNANDKAKSLLAIYRLEGDMLFLCFRADPKDNQYPSRFATDPIQGAELIVLKRSTTRPAARLIKRFTDTDWPLDRNRVRWSGGVLRIDIQPKEVVKLFRVEKPGPVERGVFVFRGQMKTSDFKDQNDLCIGGDWEDESGNRSGEGSVNIFPSTDWKSWIVNPNTTRGDRPALVDLYLQNQSDKEGAVWIKDLELVELDPSAFSGQPLDGHWIAVSAEYQGREVPLEEAKNKFPSAMLIKANQYGITWAGKQHEGTLRIDPTKNPAEIDFSGSVFDPVTPRKAIYELEGDRLKLCLAFVGPNADPPRPTSFRTDPPSQNVVLIYRRAR